MGFCLKLYLKGAITKYYFVMDGQAILWNLYKNEWKVPESSHGPKILSANMFEKKFTLLSCID